ncbi:MAG: Rab family GTPase [Cyanobacteria bacterium P01_C01_bin.89]
MAKVSKKICLVGDFGVGKTSLIRRFVDRQFDDRYLSTVGVKISRKLVELDPSLPDIATSEVQLLIWDLEGRNKFKAIVPSYLQGARGAILVADISRPGTLRSLEEHLDQFCTINPKSKVMVALNKADLLNEGLPIDTSSLKAVDDHSQVVKRYFTSAKTGDQVDDLFVRLTYQMLRS